MCLFATQSPLRLYVHEYMVRHICSDMHRFVCHVHQFYANHVALVWGLKKPRVPTHRTWTRSRREALNRLTPTVIGNRLRQPPFVAAAAASLWGPCVDCLMTSLLPLRPEISVNPAPQCYDGLLG